MDEHVAEVEDVAVAAAEAGPPNMFRHHQFLRFPRRVAMAKAKARVCPKERAKAKARVPKERAKAR